MSNSPIVLSVPYTFQFTQEHIDEFVKNVEDSGYKILDIPAFLTKYVQKWAEHGELEMIWDDQVYGDGLSLEEVMDEEDEGTLFEIVDQDD